MPIFPQSACSLTNFLSQAELKLTSSQMLSRLVIAFILHRRRMTASQAADTIASDTRHRAQVTRFLAGAGSKIENANDVYRQILLRAEAARGPFIFIVDATMVSHSGKKTQNTYSTGNRGRNPAKGRRYNKKKIVYKKVHSFTFGLLLTPLGTRSPMQIPHYTQEYCRTHKIEHRTTAEAAAEMIRNLPLPEDARVIVVGDAAYESEVVRQACEERGYIWIFPANAERVYDGPKGNRPKVRSRLEDWSSLSLKKIRLRASQGMYASHRRLSQWRIGPKQKTRKYHAYQETRQVRNVGRVQIVFSTTKPGLVVATPDDVKILMTNALDMSLREIVELYAIRWQIELFFKELKSTLGMHHYRFQKFEAVRNWVESAITTVLFLEYERLKHMQNRRLSEETREWWGRQRLHGLGEAFRQEVERKEIEYLSARLKTRGGIARLKRQLAAAISKEYRRPA